MKTQDNPLHETYLRLAYTPAQLAKMLGVTTNRIRRWIKDGLLKANKMGRTWLIPQSEVRRLSGLNAPQLDAFIAWTQHGVLLDNPGVVRTYPHLESGSAGVKLSTPPQALKYKSDRLDYVLQQMVTKGGFYGATLSDHSGLTVAEYTPPFEREHINAFVSVTAKFIEQTERILDLEDFSALVLQTNGGLDLIVVVQILIGEDRYLLTSVMPAKGSKLEAINSAIDLIKEVLNG